MLMNAILIKWIKLSPYPNFFKAEKRKSQSTLSKDLRKCKDITERFLFSSLDTSIISRTVERELFYFLIAADCFSPIIVSNVFYSRFLRIVVYGSLICNIVFITTFYIYDRYDSCPRSNTHGTKLFPGVINI